MLENNQNYNFFPIRWSLLNSTRRSKLVRADLKAHNWKTGRGEKVPVTNHALQAWVSWRGSLGDVTDGMGGGQPAKRQNKRTGRTREARKWEAFDSLSRGLNSPPMSWPHSVHRCSTRSLKYARNNVFVLVLLLVARWKVMKRLAPENFSAATRASSLSLSLCFYLFLFLLLSLSLSLGFLSVSRSIDIFRVHFHPIANNSSVAFSDFLFVTRPFHTAETRLFFLKVPERNLFLFFFLSFLILCLCLNLNLPLTLIRSFELFRSHIDRLCKLKSRRKCWWCKQYLLDWSWNLLLFMSSPCNAYAIELRNE